MKRFIAGGVAVAAIAAWVVLAGDGGAPVPAASAARTSTAEVERRDLVERESFDGTLGFAGARSVRSGLGGTVTWVRDEGDRLRRGSRLYEIDERPVFAMIGRIPAWRALDASAEDGRDVRQLEANLRALGHDPGGVMTVDGDWDEATTASVRRWEEANGLDEDGNVGLGEIVFVPSRARVGDVRVQRGDAAGLGAEVMTVTSRRRVVTLELDASQRSLAAEGDDAEVVLPGDVRVTGVIEDVGRVAQTDPSDEDADPHVVVTVSLRGADGAGEFDQTPVDVELTVDRRTDVLAVPVTALVALAEGGFALERPGGRLVAVETGMHADGWVEITGAGIEAGVEVVVPS